MGAFNENKLTMISILTSIIALLLVLLVVWVHLSTQEQVQTLQLKVQKMQKSMDYADSLAPEIAQMRNHIHRLEDTLNQPMAPPKVEVSSQVPKIKMISPQTPVQKIEQKVQVASTIIPKTSHAWLVVIASFDRLEKAKNAQQRKKIAQLQSSITTVHLKHGTWFRVVRSGFASKAEAQAFAKRIQNLGFKDAWVQHLP